MKKVLKVIQNKYFIATALFLAVILFTDGSNIISWGRNYFHALRQERAIRQYEQNILSIDERLHELTSDTDSLEKFAREQYYYQKKGEDVFIVE